MRTAFPLFIVLDEDFSDYKKRMTWNLPANGKAGEWHHREPGTIVGGSQPGVNGFMATGSSKVFEWYRPGARIYLVEVKGVGRKRAGHVMYDSMRVLYELKYTDEMIDAWPQIKLFCHITARDRGEISNLKFYKADFRGFHFNPKMVLSGCEFVKCVFSGAYMGHVWMQDCLFRSCAFNRCDLVSADFSRSRIEGCSFRQSNLFYTKFIDSQIVDCDTHLSQIGFVDLTDASINEKTRLEIPLHLKDEIRKLNDADFFVVPGSPELDKQLSDFDRDEDDVTVSHNYQIDGPREEDY